MSLLNYTTKVSADKTVSEIQKMLAKSGAKRIMNEYDDNGYIMSLSFQIDVNGQEFGFKLPCDWRPVLTILEDDVKVPRSQVNQEQALRVAWRIVKDWVEAQLAIVETKMVKTEQVFLPYMMNGNKTIYDSMVDSKFLLGEAQ